MQASNYKLQLERIFFFKKNGQFLSIINFMFIYFDKGITMLILATDMARHGEIMDNFKMKLEPEFDYKNKDSLDTVYTRGLCRL